MSTRAKRILIVDDDAANRSVIGTILMEHGYEVSTAPNGKAGLFKAVDESFDLILTDNDMPVMTGVEMVKQFRDRYPESPPIIMVSGKDEGVTTPGLNGFLKKPFKLENLIVMVERLTVPYLH